MRLPPLNTNGQLRDKGSVHCQYTLHESNAKSIAVKCFRLNGTMT